MPKNVNRGDDSNHHGEIGTAAIDSYRDSFINCATYLTRVHKVDPQAIYMATFTLPETVADMARVFWDSQ